MSLYAKYLLEKEGKHHYEIPGKGFITYLIIPQNHECFIETVFVEKEYRKNNVATELENYVIEKAKELECKFLTGVVYTHSKNSTEAMHVMIRQGYKLLSSDDIKINIYKEI